MDTSPATKAGATEKITFTMSFAQIKRFADMGAVLTIQYALPSNDIEQLVSGASMNINANIAGKKTSISPT